MRYNVVEKRSWVIKMNGTGSLLRRNIWIFVRDRSAVFSSILSMLIILGLMALFLGDMSTKDIVEILNQTGGERDALRDREHAAYLVWTWTLAGILTTNAVTVTMTVMGNMIKDKTSGRLASFFITPVSRLRIALGYILSAWIIGIAMCMVTLTAAQGYMAVSGQPLLSGTACVKLAGMVALNAFVYAAIAYLAALFVDSESAWSGILTIVGTLVGFVGAIYLPMAALPEKVASVLKGLPVLHGASMMRRVTTQAAAETVFEGLPAEIIDIFNEKMGVTVIMGEKTVAIGAQAVCLLALGIGALLLSVFVSRKKKQPV